MTVLMLPVTSRKRWVRFCEDVGLFVVTVRL